MTTQVEFIIIICMLPLKAVFLSLGTADVHQIILCCGEVPYELQGAVTTKSSSRHCQIYPGGYIVELRCCYKELALLVLALDSAPLRWHHRVGGQMESLRRSSWAIAACSSLYPLKGNFCNTSPLTTKTNHPDSALHCELYEIKYLSACLYHL